MVCQFWLVKQFKNAVGKDECLILFFVTKYFSLHFEFYDCCNLPLYNKSVTPQEKLNKNSATNNHFFCSSVRVSFLY